MTDDADDPKPPPDVSLAESYDQLMERIADGYYLEDPDHPEYDVVRGHTEWLGIEWIHSSDAGGPPAGAADSPPAEGGDPETPPPEAGADPAEAEGSESAPRDAGSGNPWEHLDDVPADLLPPTDDEIAAAMGTDAPAATNDAPAEPADQGGGGNP